MFDNFDWVTLGLLSFLLLMPKLRFIPVSGTYVNIRVEDFVVALIYGLWGVGWLMGRFSLRKVFNYQPVLIFLVYGGIITFLGITVFGTVKEPHLGVLHWLRRVEYFGIYFLAATSLKRERLKEYLYVLLSIGIITWFYAVLQWQNVVPGAHTLNKSGKLEAYSQIGYVISTFAAHYDYGAFLILMVALSIWGYFSHRNRRAKLFFVFWAFAFWWMSRLVYGRAAYLGMLLAAGLMLGVKLSPWAFLPSYEVLRTFDRYFGGRFSRYSYNFRFDILPGRPLRPTPTVPSPTPSTVESAVTTGSDKFTSTAKPALTPHPGPTQAQSQFKEQLDALVTKWSDSLNSVIGRVDVKLDPSANIRLREWPDALAKVGYHFFWGGGYYTAGLGTDNDYVRHLVEVGVIGSALFFLIIFDFMRVMWRNFKAQLDPWAKHFHLAMLVFVIGLLVEAVFIDIFASSKIAFTFWFLMGLVSRYSKIEG